MIRTFAILALLIAAAQATNVTFTSCGGDGAVNWVDVTPCDAEPCTFAPGQDVTVTGELVTASTSSSPQLLVQVNVLGFWVQYPTLDTNGCLYASCPIQASATTPFTITLTTLDWLPNGDYQIQFVLNGDDGSTQVCAQAEITIAN